MKNKITVELCDKEYALLSEENEEYVKSLAIEINQMVEKTAYSNLRISKADATVLTCLDLCDRNRKLTNNNDNMRKQITMYVDEIASLNKKLLAYERQKPGKFPKNTDAGDETEAKDAAGPQEGEKSQ
ncbi:MAG: cell division protein ZapA [Oscillospiraceae bacterium]|nr:cell division protein ZapA [Oscillospiraceae bacterium]